MGTFVAISLMKPIASHIVLIERCQNLVKGGHEWKHQVVPHPSVSVVEPRFSTSATFEMLTQRLGHPPLVF